MKRVAVFVPAGIRPSPSGLYVPALSDLIDNLSNNFDLTVFAVATPDENHTEFMLGNARVTFLPGRFDDSIALRTFRFIRKFMRIHRKNRFEMIHAMWAMPSGLAAVILNKISQVPALVSLYGGEAASLPEIHYGNMRRYPLRSATLWVCEQASSLTCLTNFQLRLIRSHGMQRDCVSVIPFGVDTSKFRPLQEHGAFTSPFRFLSVGDLNRIKDPLTVLRCFQAISKEIPAELRIIGNDQSGREIAREATRLGIGERVVFLGHIPHESLATHYQWAHVLLHTSLYESQALVVTEAMASGVLVAGTKVGLIADLGDQIAVAVSPGDFRTLAASLLSVLRHPHLFESMRSAGLQWAIKYDHCWTAARYSEIYAQIR